MLKKQSKKEGCPPLNNRSSEIVHIEEKNYTSVSFLSAAAVAVIFITLGATIHYTAVNLTNLNLENSEVKVVETADKQDVENLRRFEKNETEDLKNKTTKLQTKEKKTRKRRETVFKKQQNEILWEDKILKKLKNLTKIRNRRHLPKHLLHRYLSLIRQIEEQSRHHINLTLAAKNFVESVVQHIDLNQKNSTKRDIEEDIEETSEEVYPKNGKDEIEKVLDHTTTPSYSYDMNNEIKADITALTKVENKVETDINNENEDNQKQSLNETFQNKNSNKSKIKQQKNDNFENARINITLSKKNQSHDYVKSNQTNKHHYLKTKFIHQFNNPALNHTADHSLRSIQANVSSFEITTTSATFLSINNDTNIFQNKDKNISEFLKDNQLQELQTTNRKSITDVYKTTYSLHVSEISVVASEISITASLYSSIISMQDSSHQANEIDLNTKEISSQASQSQASQSQASQSQASQSQASQSQASQSQASQSQASQISLQFSEINSEMSETNIQASQLATPQVSENVHVNQKNTFPLESTLSDLDISSKSKIGIQSTIINMNTLKNYPQFKNEIEKINHTPLQTPFHTSLYSTYSLNSENSFQQEATIEINSNSIFEIKNSLSEVIIPTKSFTARTQLENPTIEIYDTYTMTPSSNTPSSFSKHSDDDDQDLKDFFEHVQIENSLNQRINFSRSITLNESISIHPTMLFILPSQTEEQTSIYTEKLISFSRTDKLYASIVSSSSQTSNTSSSLFNQQNKLSNNKKYVYIGDLFNEKITENQKQNKKEIKSNSVDSKNNFVISSSLVTSNNSINIDSHTSIDSVTSSNYIIINSVTTQPAHYNEYKSNSKPTISTETSMTKSNSDYLHHTIKNEQNSMTTSKNTQQTFSRTNKNKQTAYSTKPYNNQKIHNHIGLNNTIILNNPVEKRNPFTTLQPMLPTKKSTWQQITNPITDLITNNEAKSRDQITQILSDSETQDKKTNVGPGVIKFLQQTLLHIDENAKLAVKSTNSSVNTSPYTLDWICRNDVTDWSTAYIIGMSRFLQNHIINCKENEFLQKFRLSDNKDNFFPLFRYEYVCCSLALVKT